ncbi:MAG: tetratricopeptide repeat protein [Verrucomicrobiaceae bacterium]|nr:tetratricopeptide repeat protein [Verrucomicrobiaceae bacterium]
MNTVSQLFTVGLACVVLFTLSVPSADAVDGVTDKATPLPIDPLWKSPTFRKALTASYGIDSRIEPHITQDEAFYLDKVSTAMASEDRPAAIKTLTDSSLLDDSTIMLFTLASLQFEDGKTEEAVGLFQRAIEKFPNFRDAHRNLAIALLRLDRFDEAKTHLVRALELGSQDGLTAGLLGYCHARDEHHQAALDAYRLAMLTQPGEYQWRIGEAQALQALGHSREAAAIYQSLLADDPVGTDTWLAQADIWIHLDQPLRAVANLEIVHRSGTLDPSATLSLGHLYHQNGLPDLALERYRAAILAEEPVRLARAVDALELLTNASDWARAKALAGLIASSEIYQAALADDKADTQLTSRLTRSRALIELESGDAAAGAKLVEDWLAREPLDGLSLILLARFREGKDRIEEAVMLLEQAERIPEHAAAAHLAHGQILVAQSRYEEAVEQLEKSHELKPGKSVAEYLKAVRELR